MSQPRIDLKRIRDLCDYATKLGFRVVHVHADIKTPGEPARVKIDMQQKEPK